MDASYSLAKYFNEIKFEDLPQNVVSEVKKQILDYIGVAIAGACKPGANEIRELYEELGGVEQASVWCVPARSCPSPARLRSMPLLAIVWTSTTCTKKPLCIPASCPFPLL